MTLFLEQATALLGKLMTKWQALEVAQVTTCHNDDANVAASNARNKWKDKLDNCLISDDRFMKIHCFKLCSQSYSPACWIISVEEL